MPAIELTDRIVKALRRKPAAKGERYDVLDTVVRGFGVRVNERGELVYFLAGRYPGSKNPTRRTIAQHGEKTLADARKVAIAWKDLLRKGVDPAEQAERERRENERRRANTFSAVAEDFIASMDPTERKRHEVIRDIRKELVGAWGDRPVLEIGPRDTIDLVVGIKTRGAPYQARNVLGYAKRLFSWAVSQHAYGLTHSPCDSLRPEKIIGKKLSRKRVFDNDELRALWRVACRLPYPYGPMLRLLILTGGRRSEIAEASWREIDTERRALVIPAGRQKSDEAHVVPLSDDAWSILQSLPRFETGDFIFSTTHGVKPINGWSKLKDMIDPKAVRTWRAIGRSRRRSPQGQSRALGLSRHSPDHADPSIGPADPAACGRADHRARSLRAYPGLRSVVLPAREARRIAAMGRAAALDRGPTGGTRCQR